MAEGFLKSFDETMEVSSAGTFPALRVHPSAIQVMEEAGIDISQHRPKNVDIFLRDEFDYVITVCDDAREACPVFSGRVRHRIHLPFEDPSLAGGSTVEKMMIFRKARDEMKESLARLFTTRIHPGT
jgi:arsenate reductase